MHDGAILVHLLGVSTASLVALWGPIGMLVVAPSLMVMPVPARLTCSTWRAKSQAGWV
jgi:hypothetical protein